MSAEQVAAARRPVLVLDDVALTATARRPGLSGLSLHVQAGEFIAVEGPADGGRVALLAVLSGAVRPRRGRMRVLDIDVGEQPPAALAALRRNHVGVLLRGGHLFPWLSVADNVAVALAARGRGGAVADDVERLLDLAGVGDVAGDFPGQLAPAQRQRVALARAFAGMPEIVLADEPAVDCEGADACAVVGLLRDLARMGGAVVALTASATVADAADRRYLFENGLLENGAIRSSGE